MGLFQHRPEDEENQWAGLPSEPLEHGVADTLDAAPAVDPAAIEFGPAYTSVVFPVAPPAPEAETSATGEPD